MPEYQVNKGVNKSAEFKGLKAQYLYIFGGGLLCCFLLFVVLYALMRLHIAFCLISVISIGSGLTYLTFSINRKYGEHGLMKLQAKSAEPKLLYQQGDFSRRLRGNGRERAKKKLQKYL